MLQFCRSNLLDGELSWMILRDHSWRYCSTSSFSHVINLLLTRLVLNRTGRGQPWQFFLYGLCFSWFILSRTWDDFLPVQPSCLVNKIHLEVPVKWKIIVAYLKGFSEYRRMAFPFWNTFFRFRGFKVFVLCKLAVGVINLVCENSLAS